MTDSFVKTVDHDAYGRPWRPWNFGHPLTDRGVNGKHPPIIGGNGYPLWCWNNQAWISDEIRFGKK
jgi:hypothetical protein